METYNLNTENKNIVDAINELKESTDNLSNDLSNITEILIAINNGNL